MSAHQETHTIEEMRAAFQAGQRIAHTVTDQTSLGSHGEAHKHGYVKYSFLAKCFACGFEIEREHIKEARRVA